MLGCPAAGVGSYEVENIMSSGQGKFPLEVVTDNNLLRQRYENDELGGANLLMVTTSAQGVGKGPGNIYSGGLSAMQFERLYVRTKHLGGKSVALFNAAPASAINATASLVPSHPDYPGFKPSASPLSTEMTVTGTGGANQCVFYVTAEQAQAMSASAGTFELWLDIPDRVALSSSAAMGVSITFDGGAGTAFTTTQWDCGTILFPPVGGLQKIIIDKGKFTSPGTGVDWSLVTHARVYLTNGAILNIGAKWRIVALNFAARSNKPLVSITMDKCGYSQFFYAAPYLASKGIPVTMSLIGTQVGTGSGTSQICSVAQLMELATIGDVTVIPHTTGPASSFASDQACYDALLANIALIQSFGLPNFDPRIVKYASGNYSKSGLDEGVAAMLRSSGWCQAALISSGGGFLPPFNTERYRLTRTIVQGPSLDTTVALADIQTDLLAGRSRVVSFHDLTKTPTLGSDLDPAKMRTVVDGIVEFAQQGLCDIVSLPELISRSA